MRKVEKIRNVAIVAHIDHGKTTLLDGLLKQSQVFADHEKIPERVMDSYDQEKERGITIFSKHTGLFFEDFKINLIDTPGHADFAGEVERVLGMVNSVLLLVDAQEGPMPQTRFVLSKALQMGLKPIVVLNKIDRPHADPDRVLNETFDLFAELGASDEQLDFPYCFASGLSGYATREVDEKGVDMRPLFEMIVEKVPVAEGDLDQPFLMQAATIAYDDYLGRQVVGRVLNGVLRKGENVVHVDREGQERPVKVTKLESYFGLQCVEIEEASVGDIVKVSGIENPMVGDSLCAPSRVVKLDPIPMDEPTLSIDIMVNSGPLSGKDGKHLTMSKIKDRLLHEKRSNISLSIKMDEGGSEKVTVCGRGELHLAVLIEAMRREGYELTFSKPQVIVKHLEGVKCEPAERVHIEVPEASSGAVIEEMARRKGEMQSLHTDSFGNSKMEFLIPTRGLMGYRNEFLTVTKGRGILASVFEKFIPWKGEIPHRKQGVMVSMCNGQATGYACFNLQARGILFVSPGDEVYEGMIVGEQSRENDLLVNVVKGKQLTNVRASGKDESIILVPPHKMHLEQAIDYIQEDELVEVTPNIVRMRKTVLTESERKKVSRK